MKEKRLRHLYIFDGDAVCIAVCSLKSQNSASELCMKLMKNCIIWDL